jgi:hypothetical protein
VNLNLLGYTKTLNVCRLLPRLQEYPGVPPEKLPEHEKPSRVHFDNLGERFQAATHAGVKGKHLRAVTILGTVLSRRTSTNRGQWCMPMNVDAVICAPSASF